MFGAKINRQPGPINEDALQMLRDKKLKKFSEVLTADDEFLGTAVHLHLRQDDVNADLKLYAAYLDVANLRMGVHFHVPTDFIQAYDPESNQVTLTVPFAVVQAESWDREPDFIARNLGKIEELEKQGE
jgi:hypothetical protein